MRKNEIVTFLHCRRCLQTKPANVSLRQWARLEVGITKEGAVQVWCVRHDINVGHTDDMEGADTSCEACNKGVPHAH